jgi:hypothetical protein
VPVDDPFDKAPEIENKLVIQERGRDSLFNDRKESPKVSISSNR